MSGVVNDDQIVIDIEDSLDASGRFETNNLLQRKAIGKIKRLIESRLEKVKMCDHQDCENDRRHDTITILGERGSGKTSLLLNLETILVKHKKDLVFLKIIDPTLFETKQNILVSIISLIADKVKDKNKEADDDWNESLIKLADGLKLLDGVGSDIIKSDLFDDGTLILEKGLDHAHSGLNLEKYFNCYIVKSLSLLDQKMFVVIFDDIDTNIDKGWMVLETIRKYLTSCQLQVFVSGDWGLYSSLVRMKQWENFDRKILPEKEWHNKEDLIDQLEEQYLIKVLKPEYRIYLENLYQLTKKPEQILVNGFNTNPIKIDTIYKYISQILFRFQNEFQTQDVSNLIKQLPMRTNMKILYAQLVNQEDAEELINAISNVFITNTARFNFTHLDYENLSPNAVIQEMAKKLYLISSDKFSFQKLSYFPMNLSDKDLNLLLMIINLHLMKTIDNHINTFFEWLTRFTYLEIIGREIYDNDKKNELLSNLKYDYIISMKDQLDEIDQYSRRSARSSMPGFRLTYAHDGVAKERGFIGVDKFLLNDKCDEVFLLSIMSSRKKLAAHAEQTTVSIINIFAFLSDFLQISKDQAETYLFNIFEMFHYAESGLFDPVKNNDINENTLFKSLLEWHALKEDIKMFSIPQTNSIWEGFLQKHELELQNKKFITVKDFISTQCIIFFNSLITETLFNSNMTTPYSSINTTTNLNRNIGIAYNLEQTFYDTENLDLFKYMYMCPLFYCFIDDEKYIKPDNKYWVGEENKNRILTSFSKLGIHGESMKKDLSEIITKYITLNDLRKITDLEIPTLENVIEQIKSAEISNYEDLWNKIKPPKNRITTEREAILKRFMTNVQNDIKTDDTSTN
ncbi:MAG: hypothetical protein PHW64_00395 [Sulfuricurvum sp.]|nr:hypothetical protein [Sulfuricurvum sp.]